MSYSTSTCLSAVEQIMFRIVDLKKVSKTRFGDGFIDLCAEVPPQNLSTHKQIYCYLCIRDELSGKGRIKYGFSSLLLASTIVLQSR